METTYYTIIIYPGFMKTSKGSVTADGCLIGKGQESDLELTFPSAIWRTTMQHKQSFVTPKLTGKQTAQRVASPV